jgi:D-alanyl-D-alanine dipeptidase
MKKQKLLIAVSVSLFSLTVTMAQEYDHTKMRTDDTVQMKIDNKIRYACNMKFDGEKTYEKEGTCPKCGMTLIKLEEGLRVDSKKESSGKKMVQECYHFIVV